MGLWGRCLIPDTLVSDEAAKQRGSPHTPSRPSWGMGTCSIRTGPRVPCPMR